MEKLTEYLTTHGITQAAMAADVGVTQSALSKLCSGKQPSLDLALRIERATSGQIAVEDWPAFCQLAARPANQSQGAS